MQKEKKWWQMPVRMLRVDYVPDFSSIKKEDLDKLARSRKEAWHINCEWLVAATDSHASRGERMTFKAEGYDQCQGFEEFDYLRRYTPSAHKYGIRTIAYLNMHWYSCEFADQHPEWEQIMSNGERYGRAHPLYGSGTTFCVNGAWRNWAFGLMREAMKTGIDGVFLDGPVIFPDCCYCDACHAVFRAKYNQSIPGDDWSNPLWKQFLEFREDSLAMFLKDAREQVRLVNPEAVIFLNAGSWEPGGWRVARDIQKTGPYQNFIGTEAFFHYGKNQNIYASLMTGKYLRAMGQPAVVFTHYMNGMWHYRNLPPGEVKLALAQTMAAGANPWLALLRPALDFQPESVLPVAEMFSFMERNKDCFTDVESMAEVGLLFSAVTSRNYLSRFTGFYEKTGAAKEENLIVDLEKGGITDWKARKRQCEELLTSSYRGYFHALTRAHIPFDIVLDQGMTSTNLGKYKTLILPDAACLGKAAVAALKQFVREGGNLLASFEAGFYDDQGNYHEDMFELFGISRVKGFFPVMMGENYTQIARDHAGFKAGNLIERGAYALKIEPAKGVDRPAFFMEAVDKVYAPLHGVSKYPALIIGKYGKGTVAYFPEALGHFYGETGMISAQTRIAGMTGMLGGTSLLEVSAPQSISVELFRSRERNSIMVHVVNNTADYRPINDFVPVSGIKLSLKLKKSPQSVRPLRENATLGHSVLNGRLQIEILCLELYEVIEVLS